MKTTKHNAQPLFKTCAAFVICSFLFSSISVAQTETTDSDMEIHKMDLASVSVGSSSSEEASTLVLPVFNKTKKYRDIGEYVAKNIDFPEEGIETGKSGMMKVQFQIMTDGTVDHIQYLESPGEAFEKNVTDVLQNAPLWTPANRNSKPVQTTYQLHINFALL